MAPGTRSFQHYVADNYRESGAILRGKNNDNWLTLLVRLAQGGFGRGMKVRKQGMTLFGLRGQRLNIQLDDRTAVRHQHLPNPKQRTRWPRG